MKEFKLKKREVVELSNMLTVFSKETFPGVLKFKFNIDILKPIVDDINKDYIKMFPEHLKDKVHVSTFQKTGQMQSGELEFEFFDIRRCSILNNMSKDKIRPFQDAINAIEEKEITIFLKELDVSLPVFLVKDRVKIILRDYLEQMIEPIDMLLHLNKIGVIINLFENEQKNIS